jgi:hypothetical protein
MNWDAWLQGHRLARAVGMLVILIGSIVFWEFNNPGSVTHKEPMTAVVSEVFDKAYRLTLENGREARVFRSAEYRLGDRVTVTVSTYANGESTVLLIDDTP